MTIIHAELVLQYYLMEPLVKMFKHLKPAFLMSTALFLKCFTGLEDKDFHITIPLCTTLQIYHNPLLKFPPQVFCSIQG